MLHNSKATPTLQSSLEEWLYYLEHSHSKAIDLGLERVKSVAQALDLLTPAPYVITVGGTNGKGTTCRLLETILLNAGFKVGVYSSPHLICYNERVRIQNQDVQDEDHIRAFQFINTHKNQSLSYFEFSTLSALHLFKQANLDVVILEVGLGGRLDATNIVDADMAVITSIDIDHIDYLGDTREKIGFEKAGIFRVNKPVIIGEPDIPHSMIEYAKSLNCQLSCRNQDWQFEITGEQWKWQNNNCQLGNLPLCQIPLANAATALAAVQSLPFNISAEILRKSLNEVELVGRFQTVKAENLTALIKLTEKSLQDLPRIIIDVGHNPHAARYLAEKLTQLKSKISGKITAVCGILQDKDAENVLSPLLSIIDEWHCVTLSGYRGQTGEQLAEKLYSVAEKQAINVKVQVENSVALGVESAVKNTDKNDVVLVFGSFHTVGEFLQIGGT
ncbi:bifunctional tetrahydrofolate synthase/dihydrofolate synthase [Lonepinella koalarum]|uniref:Dihydrofolate synthase/folylpolyglutamate synthase n=1 Tax=Lonepinella koalarum TaxID=53417 RepID=A0A4R1KT28_9PAST|nr:bifunctional tetrahydrofolate synthase/dihydrofolate synthase [Lonepinella koalarum]MDH2927127.1 bifunctional folylpolyglutamate synthase/dihydrofolate synthase [Lonepinella koalarum]TCK68204.1 dihydrofolate synthase/folylpolyglutamate synthase [Lonepinella koalarum]TFJ89406.1 bifunctional tetrahydrofolate synthase/dihydrofolate synthase [Lonepinella koalarum]